jgi:hypothetical protein
VPFFVLPNFYFLFSSFYFEFSRACHPEHSEGSALSSFPFLVSAF